MQLENKYANTISRYRNIDLYIWSIYSAWSYTTKYYIQGSNDGYF
jgi:hypothetical protein